MCCGCGYYIIVDDIWEDCDCKFVWCCWVDCKICMCKEEKYFCNWEILGLYLLRIFVKNFLCIFMYFWWNWKFVIGKLENIVENKRYNKGVLKEI